MDATELKTLLNKLKGELDSGQPVDPELRQLLHSLDQDIQQALRQPVSSTGDADDAEKSLSTQAQAIEARFAADHPYLANTLRDVLDTLGKMGI
ncbi:DUF4404 family protein [Aquabacterium sp.]|jgi:hypothetical protein|uniref:DUF4404 family protein n=1 Tax=Aquabacterium sp. TaxID=1872578 RepID=UPI0025C60AF9|nr:DUF4404 family protein [Aquabacterium sp.]